MTNFILKSAPVALAVALLAPLAPPIQAQVPNILITVSCQPCGPGFYVDGGAYTSTMSAFWPVGSKHTLSVAQGLGYSYSQNGTVQYAFQGWQWSGGSASTSTVTVTADPSVLQYTVTFNVQYMFSLQLCSDPSSCGTPPGVVLLNGTPITSNTSLWQAPGSSVTLTASPNPGWIFSGWQAGPNQTITGFQDLVSMNGPVTAYPIFVPAKSVTVTSSPAQMKVYADGVQVPTPTTLDWGIGTVHRIAAITQQVDINYNYWIFSNWSDGGALSHNYTVGSTMVPETVTANYTPAVPVSFTTLPSALPLTVDGQTLPPPYALVWGVGSTHTVQAPLQQTDAQGGVWSFSKWDDGTTSASRTIQVLASQQLLGIRMIAIYTGQSKVTVTSTLSPLAVTVDGASCSTPCTVTRPVGAQIHVSAPASLPMGGLSRQDFLGWSTNGGAPAAGDWIGTVNDTSVTLNATYHLMNHLSASANLPAGAQWTIGPASPDGFYDSQTQVSLAVTAQPGYRFSGWTGDLSGVVPSATLAMTVPRSVVAQLAAVPYVASPALINAAGETPEQAVAAGSVASIYGVNLASTTAVGPVSPLAQTLAGVTVHIGTSYLPLYFASAAQINVQVPPDLAPGQQTVTVSSQGMPDVSANFVVARNAPGLFPLVYGSQNYALALHADGSLVTPDSPAVHGEQLTVYGTGFGPTNLARPLGYPVPASPPYLIVDPVSVLVGAAPFAVDSAFALPGNIGVDVVQFHLDNSVPSGSNISFQLVVNGVNSNKLMLAVQ